MKVTCAHCETEIDEQESHEIRLLDGDGKEILYYCCDKDECEDAWWRERETQMLIRMGR